jgi:hypothetical protein
MRRASPSAPGLCVVASLALAGCGGATDGGLNGSDAGGDGGINPFPLPETGSSDAGTSMEGGPGGPDTGPMDAAPVIESGPPPGYPAPHPPLPKVIPVGGPVIAMPKFYAVTFPGDALLSSIQSLVSTIGGTAYWTANTSEYGVGPGTAGTPMALTEQAPAQIDDSQIQTWIGQKVTAGTFPPPDANTLYVVFYPASTSITLFGTSSCQQFGGYHNEGQLTNGQAFSYAIVPRCSDINELSSATSHELVEAVTDPLPQTNPAYGQVDGDHLVWPVVLGGQETGDMCAQFQSSFYQPAGFNFIVQRCWSDKAAAASHDPCAPSLPGEVYYNAAPVLNDTVTLSFMGQNTLTKGAHIPVGQSKTIEVDLFSDGPTTGPWTLDAQDAAAFFGGGNAVLNCTLDKTTGQNGDKVNLTITATAAGQFGGEPFVVHSQLGNTGHLWIGFVGN